MIWRPERSPSITADGMAPGKHLSAEHLETFLQQARTSEHHLPFHVEKEMRAYLECGVLADGFVRARWEQCGTSRAVALPLRKGQDLPRRGKAWACRPSRNRSRAPRLPPQADLEFGGG